MNGLKRTQLCRHKKITEVLIYKASVTNKKSTRRDSNPRPSPWQGDTPPLSHSCLFVGFFNRTLCIILVYLVFVNKFFYFFTRNFLTVFRPFFNNLTIALVAENTPFAPSANRAPLYSVFCFLTFKIMKTTEAIASKRANNWDTAMFVCGIKSWSVRSPSTQNRPIP